MEENLTFGQFMGSMRKRLGMTQAEATKKIGISLSYLAQMESGRRKPPNRDIVRRIAHVYAVDEKVMLIEAGYGEGPKTHIAPERVEWAFHTICTDPTFQFGNALRHKSFDVDTKAFLVECYSQCTGRMLLTEGVREQASAKGAADGTPSAVAPWEWPGLEEQVEAVLHHLKPQVRRLLKEGKCKVSVSEAKEQALMAKEQLSAGTQLTATTDFPSASADASPGETEVEPINRPARRMRLKTDEAPQKVPATDPNPESPEAPITRRMRK